jgi:YHS domain-containing protein
MRWATGSATDPVTGRAVDKATALIAATPDGRVLYFESAQTLSRFVAQEGETR